jgi:hypothetical protein
VLVERQRHNSTSLQICGRAGLRSQLPANFNEETEVDTRIVGRAEYPCRPFGLQDVGGVAFGAVMTWQHRSARTLIYFRPQKLGLF